jgi:hypothetical protein
MDFDALYTRAGAIDIGHCEHPGSFKQQAIDSKVVTNTISWLQRPIIAFLEITLRGFHMLSPRLGTHLDGWLSLLPSHEMFSSVVPRAPHRVSSLATNLRPQGSFRPRCAQVRSASFRCAKARSAPSISSMHIQFLTSPLAPIAPISWPSSILMRCQEPLHISTGELHAFERRSGLDKLKIAGYILNHIYYIRNTCINRAWLN